jgi:cytochrome c-type biogenesis protein CcmH
MAGFLLAALVIVVLVLSLVLRPLWRGMRGVALALASALVVSAASLYLLVGTPAALDPAARAAPTTLPEAISRLEAQLAQDPLDADGWRLLARAYTAEGRADKARDAFARAATLAPDDPDVLTEAAQGSAMADARHRLDPQAVGWLRHALQVQPQHQRARWLLGVSQRQAGKPADAARTWEPLLAQVDAQTAVALREQVQAARKDAGLPPLPAASDRAPAPAAAALTVRVALDPRLAERVRLRGDAAVFVIARAPGGPPMPIAAERRQASELPLTVTLDDNDSPMPTGKLSAQREVELVARISNDGNAMPQPGDLESAPVRVTLPRDQPVELQIGKARE